ncbi:MAG TPA: type I-E CRISPR-associated protein Cas5/CasD [Anaerolineae bacterium]|jgi:CRISPR system Cascade subunit CasD
MNTLLLYLTGPMQAWGHRSRFDDRDTGLEPTRSGIIGLFCCALGIGRNGDLVQFADMRLGVRVDAEGQPMTDFHTAMRVARAGGGIADTVTSHRHYLTDARFLVGIGHEDLALLRAWEAALRNPVWPLYLGRKSCPPAGPILLPNDPIRPSADVGQALCDEPWYRLREREAKPEQVRLTLETDDPQEGQARADVPLSFESRRFTLRYLTHNYIPVKEGGQWPCISHA